MAGLYYFHKIPKIALPAKTFGVFEHSIIAQDSLLTGIDEIVKMPHSRHSGIDEMKAKHSGLKILLEGELSGISILKDEKDYFILAHPEYAKDTLLLEYERDKQKGLAIQKPINYFDQAGKPILSWKSSASVMFANWLNFSVYQNTPFVLWGLTRFYIQCLILSFFKVKNKIFITSVSKLREGNIHKSYPFTFII